MQTISNLWWIWPILFLVSLGYILDQKRKESKEIKTQFIVTGTLLLIFYIVCFISGICTILNFLFNWVF